MSISTMDLVALAKQNITEAELETVKQALFKELILDVREPEEHAKGRLPEAINIPRGVLEFKISNHTDFQNQQEAKIIVYCQTGGRSALATEALLNWDIKMLSVWQVASKPGLKVACKLSSSSTPSMLH